MLLPVRSTFHLRNCNLVRLGCALASVLTFTLSSACGKSCPEGYVERDSQCVRPTDLVDFDAGTQQDNAIEQLPGSDADVRKPDSSPANKPVTGTMTNTTPGKANGTPTPGGTGGASGESADVGGSGGDTVEPPPPMEMKPRKCLVGATRCSEVELAVEVCTVDDEWVVKESCLATCQDGACSGDCRPGEMHCGSNQSTETCSEMGVWTPAETCPFVCSDGVCGGDCVPGSLQCGGSDGLTVQTCDESGHYGDTTHCQNICSSGSCSGTCMPRTLRCRTSTTPEECSDAGNWEARLPCPFLCGEGGQCVGECRPGSKLCIDQTPTTCDPTGHWVQEAACTNVGKACVNGVCGGACVPGNLRCGPDQAKQKCSETGSWELERRCQFVCTGAGECTGTCSPDSKICEGNTLRTCRGNGEGYSDLVCPPAQANETASCSGNACSSFCEPANRCAGSSLCWRLQYGCEQCAAPYVWREANVADKVCVSQAARARTLAENGNAMYVVQEVCPVPFVWREATRDDHRCVPVEIRTQVSEENAAGPSLTQVATGRQP